MQKVFTVAKREFQAAVMTKAFLISIIMMPIMMGGSILIQFLTKDVKSTKDKNYVVINRTTSTALYENLVKAVEERNKKQMKADGKLKGPKFVLSSLPPSGNTEEAILEQRYELAQRCRQGEIDGFIDIGSKLLDGSARDLMKKLQAEEDKVEGSPTQDKHKEVASQLPDEVILRYYSNRPTYNDFHVWAWQTITKLAQAEHAKTINITATSLEDIRLPTMLRNTSLPRINKITGKLEDGKDINVIVSFLVPFGIVLIMFMVIMVGATPLMQGVVEEKMQRISEVLLSSAQPFQLMLGKLLGGVAVSMLLGSVYIIGALLAAWQYGFLDYVTPTVITWFLVYLALAVLMFGSLFVAVGAACTDLKETQSLMMPVMLLTTFPLFFLTNLITEPDGTVATALSFFPFATPTLMTARLAIPPGAPWWHPVVGIIGVLATTLLCVWIASRIFRVGLLMQGKGATFGEIVKWVIRG
ncbi:MAG: ABC transporter permease [Gemmatales bacterium]